MSSLLFIISTYKSFYTNNIYWKLSNLCLIGSSFCCNVYNNNIYFLLLDYSIIFVISLIYILNSQSQCDKTLHPMPDQSHNRETFTKHIGIIYNKNIKDLFICTYPPLWVRWYEGIIQKTPIFILLWFYFFQNKNSFLENIQVFLNFIKNASLCFAFYISFYKNKILFFPCIIGAICYFLRVQIHIISNNIDLQPSIITKNENIWKCNLTKNLYFYITWIWHICITIILYFSSNNIS
jgi:hypothetical protein